MAVREADPSVFPLAVQWFGRTVQAIVSGVVLALAAWVWSAEGRIKSIESVTGANVAAVASLQATTEALKEQGTDIRLIKQDISYLRTSVDEVKALVRGRR